MHHRFAAGLLIAGQHDRVQGQGIHLGRERLFLHQATDDTGFLTIQQGRNDGFNGCGFNVGHDQAFGLNEPHHP
jgi:hypothetical protein